jgi:Protein of unknown function (DUF1761)
MNFGINYLAVLAAAVAGVVINALWYSVVMKAQVDRLRAADPTIAGRAPAPPTYGVAILGQVLMAFVLAVVLRTAGITGISGAMFAAALLWLGFTISAMAQVHTFGYRQPLFIAIDGLNWLIAALAMGAILGVWS